MPFLKEVSSGILAKAAENTLSISYRDYLGQVVAYLPQEQKAGYAPKNIWTQMQEAVWEALDQAAGNSAAS